MEFRRLIAAAAFGAALVCGAQGAWAQAPTQLGDEAPAAGRCAALAKTDFSKVMDAPTMVTSAKYSSVTDNMPGYCAIQGYVSPQVGFDLRLPGANWNGKFSHVTCGGFCGMLFPGCDDMIRRGYACIVSDMGHKSTALDAKWGYNNLQAELDWGYRATHVATLAGKAVTTKYYSRPIAKSYLLGCSTGGRQGMVEAQRFPEDFDGIVSGAPVINDIGDSMALLWAATSLADAKGMAILTHDDLRMINAAAIRRCDRDDGAMDRIIGDPRTCKFDPAELACKAGASGGCLTAAQVEGVRRTYAGPRDSAGRAIYTGGAARGSELNWINTYVGAPGETSIYWRFMSELFGYLAFIPDAGPDWKPTDFNWDRDPARVGMMEALYSGSNPDLRRFKARGGKLIIFQGWADQSVLPDNIIDYYDTAERTIGGREATQQFMRLFMIPGMSHCAGGYAADRVDYLGYLEKWVEAGQAPDMMFAANVKPEAGLASNRWGAPTPPAKEMINFSRPLYPYPLQAKYKGSGDVNDAASFRPVAPGGR